MSLADFVENLSSGSLVSVLSSSLALKVLSSEKNGVWKVKLVINNKQPEDTLSQQVNTEALIEKMRMAVAKNEATIKVGGVAAPECHDSTTEQVILGGGTEEADRVESI
ncbi:hypothetical protein V6N11_069037 [Hibiscus sabdariffa]|uniref:Uncharacterized protein n=1 Tax=Hibiscus sabdariffa TaxID=183260 RepID=A0ABR1ZP62_9ROSI